MLEKIAPCAMVINEKSFQSILSESRVLFCGNGMPKLKEIITSNHAQFSHTRADASHLAQMSFACYHNKEFADLAYAEPLYIKDFNTTSVKSD